ncbi:MAG TPA: DUF620 domain-containing protein [Bryobacteraceae bacterium]|nr:DUF620 domain-containing protein [Bryobacteraceae bacterium]
MRKLSLALFLAPIVLCNAQDALPSADAVLNRFVDAIGGRAVLEKRHNQVEHGTVEIAAMGLKGDLTIYEAEPNKNRMVIDLTGIGKIESGTDGTVAWENNPLQGPRVKQGVELTDALRDAAFNAPLSVHQLYSKIEVTGTETTEGHDCYKLVLTPKDGNPTTEYYDKTSGFLIKTSATRSTAMGDVTAEMVFDDYRKDGDEVMPHKLIQRAAQMEIQIVVAKTEVNVDLPKDAFELPADIKELVNKAPQQAAAKATAPAAASAPGSGKLTIYMGGKPTESESYTVEKSDGKIVLNGSGHAAIGPMKVDIDEFNIVTDEKFQPIEADAKGKMGQIQMNVKTSFAAGKATNQVDNGQGTQTKEDPVHPDAIVVYNPFPFYPWTVLAMRTQLKNQDPQQFPIYVLNQGEVSATVVFKGREPVEFADKTVELNHIVATGKTPQGQALSLDFWVDDNRKLIKIAVPSQGVEGYQEGYDRKAPPPAPPAEAPKVPSK